MVFEVKPSQTDIADANEKVVKVYDEFCSTDNVRNFLMKNSDSQYTDEWYKKGELRTVSTDVDNFVFDPDTKTGDVSEVITKDNTFYVARIMDTAMVPDSVFVKGILLQGVQTDLADSLLNVIKSGKDNFGNVAAQYSAMGAPQSGEPGDYGWLTKNTMFPGIESIFTAKLNDVYVVDTQYGKHILKVTDRTEPVQKKKVAVLEKEALPSGNTINEYYVQANELATKADGKYENLKKVVDEEGLALLRKIHRQMEVEDHEENFSALDRQFHTELLRMMRNRILDGLLPFIIDFFNELRKQKKLRLWKMTPYRETLSEHRAILDALEKRDAELLAEAIGKHNRIYFKLLNLNESFTGKENYDLTEKKPGPDENACRTESNLL